MLTPCIGRAKWPILLRDARPTTNAEAQTNAEEAMTKKQEPPRKAARKPDDPAQSKRFIEMGKGLGADKDGAALSRGLKKLTDHSSKK